MTKSLLQKLGLRDGVTGHVLNRPESLAAALALPELPKAAKQANFLIAFVASAADLERLATRLVAVYAAGGHLWIAYPKKTGPIKTGITRDHGWRPLKDLGFLPVTQIAIDETWSALRWRPRGEIKSITRNETML